MSRKSKRRRMRETQGAAPADGFDFLDDRDTRSTVAPASAVPLGSRAVAPAAAGDPVPLKTAPANAARAAAVADESRRASTAAAPVSDAPTRPLVAAVAPAPAPAVVTVEVDLPAGLVDGREERGVVAVVETAPAVAAAVAPSAEAAAVPEDAVAAAAADGGDAQEPLPTVGELLIAAREARGLSVESASARTRIPGKMLQHLEADRFAEFAADAYARGTLRAYGAFLGVDVALLIARYEAGAGRLQVGAAVEAAPVSAAPDDVRPAHAARTVRAPWIDRRVVLVAAGVVVAAGAVFAGVNVWRHGSALRPQAGLNQIESELRRSQPDPTAISEAPAPAAPAPARAGEDTSPRVPGATDGANSVAATATPPPADAAVPVTDLVETPVAARPGTAVASAASGPSSDNVENAVTPADGGLVLTVVATGPASVRVSTDGARATATSAQFTAGESRSWTARRSFRLVTKRGANVQLTLNGRPVPVPVDGRAVVLDRSDLNPKTAPAAARRPRQRPRTRPAPAPVPASLFEPHSGMLPPH